MEDKALIVKELLPVLQKTRNLSDLVSLEYDPKTEVVTGTFENGYQKRANVGCDSGTSLILDIVEQLL